MTANAISIEASVKATLSKAGEYYTQPEHITKWNFASDDWQCPSASNDMRVGGKYHARMEAKDGSFGFDFDLIYEEIRDKEGFTYTMADGRQAKVDFSTNGEETKVSLVFDPESINPIEMQRGGWQAILNNYKKYTEAN
jgi:uncharacterized protein YndB with AHSA1/START domain